MKPTLLNKNKKKNKKKIYNPLQKKSFFLKKLIKKNENKSC